MTDARRRLTEAIEGERRDWFRVEVLPDDIAELLAAAPVSREKLDRAAHLVANYLFNEDGEDDDWLSEAHDILRAALATPEGTEPKP